MSCPACFAGGVSASHPTGRDTTIHSLPTYISEPEKGVVPKGLIVFITDAFGWKFVNNRVLCDHYAQKGGYLVYCPDFMNGNAMSPVVLELMDKISASAPIFSITTLIYKPMYIYQTLTHAIPWKSRTKPSLTHPCIVSFLQAVRTSAPPFVTGVNGLKVGIAGFCWGGKHAFMLAADLESTRVVRHASLTDKKEALVDTIFTAHPSYIDVPGDTAAVKIPISVAVGGADMALKMDKVKEMKASLEKLNVGEAGKVAEVLVYEGAKHGFAIRTHPEDEKEMKSADEAEKQALEWFGKWLG